MKKYIFPLLTIVFLSFSCHRKDDSLSDIDFRQEMRAFVIKISDYAKVFDESFIIIPQNGQALITDNGESTGTIQTAYVNSINATGREDLFYGYDNDDQANSSDVTQQMLLLCQLFEENGVEVLTTDYCSTHSKMDDSYEKNAKYDFISFAAPDRGLSVIPDYPPQPYNVNSDDISDISQAKNFLYLINPANFLTKQDFINAVAATDYDLIIMDLFFNDGTAFTKSEISQLKKKHNGGKRLVVCYMSIGEAEDYRYYWQSDWKVGKPTWLEKENPNWKGNYKVRYWDEDWQKIIFGNANAYLDRIINAGFNGVYLDIIDAYEYFEEKY